MWHFFQNGNSRLYFISTHTSRVGCDIINAAQTVVESNFYSHIPCGMWLLTRWLRLVTVYFYSHIPCGMWRKGHLTTKLAKIFLLTHPVWDVTVPIDSYKSLYVISTHTSRVGCDMDFSYIPQIAQISTHTSRVGCDLELCTLSDNSKISTHTSRVGCD